MSLTSIFPPVAPITPLERGSGNRAPVLVFRLQRTIPAPLGRNTSWFTVLCCALVTIVRNQASRSQHWRSNQWWVAMGCRFVLIILLLPYITISGAAAHQPIALTVPPWAKRQLDVSYAPSSPAQRLDLYWPPAPDVRFPLVIAVHGGGFEGGDKRYSELDPMLTALAHGYAVAAINYRLSGEAKFPAAVVDVKAAIRYLRAHADSFHLDASRFAIWGGLSRRKSGRDDRGDVRSTGL